jgi:hypothetical protein
VVRTFTHGRSGGPLRLHVTVQLRGEIIEDTVLRVVDGLRLGEHESAVVGFPGLDLVLRLHDDAIIVRGQRLRDGDTLDLGFDDVRVHLRALSPAIGVRAAEAFWPDRVDLSLPIWIASLVLISLSVGTVQGVLARKPEVSSGLAAGVTRTVELLLLPAAVREKGRRPPGLGEPIEPPPVRYIDQYDESYIPVGPPPR